MALCLSRPQFLGSASRMEDGTQRQVPVLMKAPGTTPIPSTRLDKVACKHILRPLKPSLLAPEQFLISLQQTPAYFSSGEHILGQEASVHMGISSYLHQIPTTYTLLVQVVQFQHYESITNCPAGLGSKKGMLRESSEAVAAARAPVGNLLLLHRQAAVSETQAILLLHIQLGKERTKVKTTPAGLMGL